MSRHVLPAAVAALATLALAATLALRPGDRELGFDAYLLFLGALALVALVRATARAFPVGAPSELERVLRERPRPAPRVRELERLERTVVMSTQSAFDTYYRLRPALREIATYRLARLGVDLDGSGSRAEELLGEAAWRIVRPDLARPSDHHAHGASLATIEAAVSALEEI